MTPRGARIARSVLTFAGVVCALIGSAALAGWYLHIPELTRTSTGVQPMVANTALGMLLNGAALIFVARRRYMGVLPGAVFSLLLGVLALVQYILGIDLHIDELLVRDFALAAQPGRIAPTSALCFILAGFALFWIMSRWRDRIPALPGVLGGVLVAFGFATIIGYLSGIPVYIWGDGVRMAANTAVAFVAIGLGIAAFAWQNDQRERAGIPSWLALVAGGALFTVSVCISFALHAGLEEHIDNAVRLGMKLGSDGSGAAIAALRQKQKSSNIPFFVSAIGAVLSMVVYWLVNLTLTSKLREEAAVVVNRSLAKEVARREKAEQKLRLLSSIVECSDDAIVGKSLEGTILSWNKGAEELYGYSAEEAIGRPISMLVPMGKTDDAAKILDSIRQGKRIEHYETARIRKDQRQILVSLTVSPLFDEANRIVGASAIARDITARRLTEEALALSEERYRSLAVLTSQIVWTTNAHGEVEEMPMWRDFTGQSREEVAGWGWLHALHPDDRDRTVAVWSSAVNNRSLYVTEYRMRRRDGAYRHMAVHGVPILDGEGIIREWVGTCADITERKEAEDEIRMLNEELEQRVIERTQELAVANKELEAFAYSVSHDLRAPLRAIDGFCQILTEDHGSLVSPEAQHCLDVIQNNASKMGKLIDALLAFSRLSRQALSQQTVSIADLVQQSLEDLQVDQEGQRVEVVVGDLPACQGDSRLLKQVIVNLLSNALKYSRLREHIRIEIGVLPIAHAAPSVYYVRDNGVGFDMQYADKLFGVFQRLHTDRDYEGTGVGLAIVQRIVHRHGGRIWAESAVDQGTTFYFTLSSGQEAASDVCAGDPVNEEGRELKAWRMEA